MFFEDVYILPYTLFSVGSIVLRWTGQLLQPLILELGLVSFSNSDSELNLEISLYTSRVSIPGGPISNVSLGPSMMGS